MESARKQQQDPDALWADDEVTAVEEDAPLVPRKGKRWRWLLLAALAVAAAGGGLAYWKLGSSEPKVSFETAPVSRGRITVQVTASGTVSALKTVLVGSQVSGRVAELHADFNDTVKKGQLLARLDTQLMKAALEQARASQAVVRSNVLKAEAQLRDAERMMARQKALGAQNYLSVEVVETATSNAEVARAALAGARAQARQSAAQVEQAELNLTMAEIHSPIDGVVISRSVDVGQTVAASLQAPTIFTLAEDLRKMQVESHVAEGDVAKLSPGMTVTFTVDAFPGRKFAGRLRQVRNAAETVQNVVTYDAIVDVDNPALELRPGMTANVSFVVADRNDAVRIPNAALRFRPVGTARSAGTRLPGDQRSGAANSSRLAFPGEADRKTVFVREGATELRPVRVRVGVTDGSYTELVAGDLKEGTALVTDMSDGAEPARPAQGAPLGMPGGLGTPRVGGGGGRANRQ
jgi:HlyD family secretion protein